ncbi:catalase [Rubricoccus marinus]|uniref:Catalase n=1 Tax=Rubricoccus marinus TaxID=716817 RepID=A0A259TUC3_9BACT|nr:catalase [Rubricoccus marinus]OZC01217.1 catalase HPII [Rubricoccus marinus]
MSDPKRLTDDQGHDEAAKDRHLEPYREDADGEYLTTNTGLRVNHTDDSLKAGTRGPTLLEDFHLREKMTHFDHERVPERVVHARGSAAHGFFQVYEPLTDLTKAKVFQDPSQKTPVFVRFSTVVGFRGSADTVRDVRGWATKFYTEDGNWDLVGNNMPVFFIQDAIKFPDLVHAIKPEPDSQTPQASAAHDNFWDFISLMPESAHTIMWVLSDRGLPRSYAMMEGFGVHTFRLVNAEGKARFVKFHWRPVLGTHSLVWDETQKIAGKNPDFNRQDLWDRIEDGDYPEYELGLQVVEEEDEHAFDFDLLDPTKIIPESEVPVRIVGKMTLNRNPDNFFAETEQVAFHPGHVVPGIDFTNDPLLQGRLFSYIDTQINRFSSANFNELPINRPVAAVHNNQRDGFMRQTINRGPVNYSPNSRGGGCPMTAPESEGGYVHYAERVEGHKVRERSDSFKDFFSQPTMFWHSLTEGEQDRLVSAAHFELGKVTIMEVRERMVTDFFNHINHDLAVRVAKGIGVEPPTAFAGTETDKRIPEVSTIKRGRYDTIQTRKVAILLAEGFDHEQLMAVKEMLMDGGAMPTVVAETLGMLTSASGETVEVDESYLTTASVLFDAFFVPGGAESVEALKAHGDALHFVHEGYRHAKPIGATGEGVELLSAARLPDLDVSDGPTTSDRGVVTAHDDLDGFPGAFREAIAQYRHFDRNKKDQVPA